jgi:hypothetical protein
LTGRGQVRSLARVLEVAAGSERSFLKAPAPSSYEPLNFWRNFLSCADIPQIEGPLARFREE